MTLPLIHHTSSSPYRRPPEPRACCPRMCTDTHVCQPDPFINPVGFIQPLILYSALCRWGDCWGAPSTYISLNSGCDLRGKIFPCLKHLHLNTIPSKTSTSPKWNIELWKKIHLMPIASSVLWKQGEFHSYHTLENWQWRHADYHFQWNLCLQAAGVHL